MSPSRLNARWHERGFAAVEFAIALPFLLFLMLATAEIGRLLSQYDTLTKAVRDGARYCASVANSGSTSTVTISNCTAAGGGTGGTAPANATQNLVVTGNAAGSGGALLPGLVAGNVTVADAGGGYISVSATYTYQPVIGNIPTFGFSAPINLAIPLNAAVVMRAL